MQQKQEIDRIPVIGTLSAPNYALFVSNGLPDGHVSGHVSTLSTSKCKPLFFMGD